MSLQTFILALSWFALVFFAVGGLLLILAQSLLPAAQEAIKAHPPHGPEWARRVWYQRVRGYSVLLIVAAAAGLLAFLVAFVSHAV
ncbi:MAG: hypothetical protein M5U01_29415 [Ardenticatenaceae bacterium]|nr:hypothetical protein [Ardenticatenaceae bacterium]HBY92622.1 hypothetical protein [Chloroflexota bacterium]